MKKVTVHFKGGPGVLPGQRRNAPSEGTRPQAKGPGRVMHLEPPTNAPTCPHCGSRVLRALSHSCWPSSNTVQHLALVELEHLRRWARSRDAMQRRTFELAERIEAARDDLWGLVWHHLGNARHRTEETTNG